MLRTVTVAVLGAVAVGSLALAGCQMSKKATGTRYAYFSANPQRVVSAAEDALRDLEFNSITSSATELDGELQARTAKGEKVTIKVERESDGVSKATVKVGTFGDKSMSDMIISKTHEEIG